MAALPQCFSSHCCIESLGKLPPKGFGQHTVNVSAILRILLWIVCLAARAVGSTWATGAAASTQGGAATAATGLRRERGAAGEASAQRSQQRRQRVSVGNEEQRAKPAHSEASNGRQQAARQAHRRNGPKKALRSAVANVGKTV